MPFVLTVSVIVFLVVVLVVVVGFLIDGDAEPRD